MGKHFIPYREESKKDYGEYRDTPNANLCNEQIKLGAGIVEAIAYHTEIMTGILPGDTFAAISTRIRGNR